MTTLGIVLGLYASEYMEFVQLDVKTTFLHGDLHEDIYMQQSPSYAMHGKEKPVRVNSRRVFNGITSLMHSLCPKGREDVKWFSAYTRRSYRMEVFSF